LHGNYINARVLPNSIREFLAKYINYWTVDDLEIHASELKSMMDGSAKVIYFHCIHGTDRTGELSGEYQLKYMGYDYK